MADMKLETLISPNLPTEYPHFPNISDEMVWDASNNPYEIVYWVGVGDRVLKRGLWG